MNTGVWTQIKGEPLANIAQRAQRHIHSVIRRDKGLTLITYKELGDAISIYHRHLGDMLDVVSELDASMGLPDSTSIVVPCGCVPHLEGGEGQAGSRRR